MESAITDKPDASSATDDEQPGSSSTADGRFRNDRHMHAVNKMLQTQFPDIQGLQSTLKSQTEFDPVIVAGGYLPRGTV